jgi:hypothetical protein
VKSDFWWDLVSKSFDFLKADEIGVIFLDSWKETFIYDRADAVYVSREDFHCGSEWLEG